MKCKSSKKTKIKKKKKNPLNEALYYRELISLKLLSPRGNQTLPWIILNFVVIRGGVGGFCSLLNSAFGWATKTLRHRGENGENFVSRTFYSQQALSKKILGPSCSGTAISAFLGPISITFYHWILWRYYYFLDII